MQDSESGQLEEAPTLEEAAKALRLQRGRVGFAAVRPNPRFKPSDQVRGNGAS
jgi:hypothetical protein